jgi:hypothetical protein
VGNLEGENLRRSEDQKKVGGQKAEDRWQRVLPLFRIRDRDFHSYNRGQSTRFRVIWDTDLRG